jgi:F-type H+-transporting ATPase subunit gamma
VSDETRLRAQVASLDELRRIVTAMRSLAAAEVQAAERALPGIRRYTAILADAVAQARALVGVPAAAPPPRGPPARLIVVCSERGFVGAFNERLIAHATAEPEARHGRLWLVGARGVQLARARGLAPEWSMAMPAHTAGVFQAARQLAAEIEARFAAGELGRVALLATQRSGGQLAELQRWQLLPPELGPPSGAAAAEPSLHHLDPLELLVRVIGEHVAGQLVHALMESLASEHATRLQTMEAARHHVDDELRALAERAHRLRQEAITAELLDVITGADAVRGAG